MIRLGMQYMLQTRYELEPSAAQGLLAIINLPWSPKILYGIFADSFTLFGSRKRSYLILLSAVQIVASAAVLLAPEGNYSLPVTMCTIVYFA